MNDINTVLANAEDFLKKAFDATGEQAEDLYKEGMEAIQHAKEKAQDIQNAVENASKKAERKVDKYVHEHPWQAIGIAIGLSFICGVMCCHNK